MYAEQSSEIFTRLNDTKDPGRNQFFQYTWGSWMKNDIVEKARRETRFSIENAAKFVKDLQVKDSKIVKPQNLANGVTILPHNWTKDVIGESDFEIKSIASIHEGKHHRIYKIILSNGKELVLRIPYKLESDFAIEGKIKSEVATLDFLSLKLNANVPKVVAYGTSRSNPLQSPFILMEHIEGDLLMKQWDPMLADSESNKRKLDLVIKPIMDFMVSSLLIKFNRSGSLYFRDDVDAINQRLVPYDGETNEDFVDRWRIGPSVERAFSKNKAHLSAKQINLRNGPWDADKPLDVVEDVANIQLDAVKERLALAEAGASSKVEDVDGLSSQIEAFEHLKVMSQKLFNPKSSAIKNVDEIFTPRLHFPDLDPLNVIVREGKPYFVDFEHTSIKPFVLAGYPSFVAYQGAKVYNLEDDIPGFDEMDEVEKHQYQFMYYKTRNERLWEHALNELRHDLIAVASPHIKVLKAPYTQALECKNDKDYLFVENSIVQLQAMWNVYVANGIVNTKETKFPIQYTQESLDKHQLTLEDYQTQVMTTPFAATGGWIPQDMFAMLKEQGILTDEGNGNFKIEKEEALKDLPKAKDEKK